MVTVETVSPHRIELQASALAEFVNNQGDWLERDYPYIVERYANPARFIDSVRRQAKHEQEWQAKNPDRQPVQRARTLLVQRERVGVGIARIFPGQLVGNPQQFSQVLSRKLRGDRIEYIAVRDLDLDEEHRDIVRQLIGYTATRQVLAVQNENDAAVAPGIPLEMQNVGAPVRYLFAGLGSKGAGLHGKRGPVQLYRYEKPSTSCTGVSS